VGVSTLFHERASEQASVAAMVLSDDVKTFGKLANDAQSAERRLTGAGCRQGDLLSVPDHGRDTVKWLLAASELGIAVEILPHGVPPAGTLFAGEHDVSRTRSGASAFAPEFPGFHLVLGTSGTTGEPRRIVHSEAGLLAGAWLTASVSDELGTPDAEGPPVSGELENALRRRSPLGLGLLSGMPLSSISGITMVLRALLLGETFYGLESASSDAIWSGVERGANAIGITPQVARALVRSRPRPLPDILHVGIGGSAAGARLCQTLESVVGAPVSCGYGSTELGGAALMARPWDPPSVRWNTVGRPLPGVSVQLEGSSSDLRRLVCRSPAAMVGLLHRDRIIPREGGGIETGDSASVDSAGNYVIAGRTDFLISRGARRIDPVEIERVIEECEGVVRAGVLGVSSAVVGEQDIVAIVEVDSQKPPARGQIRRELVARLPPHHVPRSVRIVDVLPVAADGSPDRSWLRSEFA
jgi:acyl-CoA synthetase (AMP-forming)/AMP-acid ligase II